MKKLFLLLLFLSLPMFLNSKNIAILINGTPVDYSVYKDPGGGINAEARNWYDIFMAYEYLIEKAGYEHDNMIFPQQPTTKPLPVKCIRKKIFLLLLNFSAVKKTTKNRMMLHYIA